MMPPAPTRQNSAATNAQKYFRKADQSEASVNQMRRTERQATAAKTAKLRGLRLAKDEADKAAQEAVDSAGKPEAEPQISRKRVARAKPAAMKRMTY
jgi:hypothetical protein